MGPKIKCSAQSCIHNLGGVHCGAQSISVNINKSTNDIETICDTYQKAYGADTAVLDANINYSGLASSSIGSLDINPITHCSVKTCKYHGNGDHCNASHIEIAEGETSLCKTFQKGY